MTTITIFPEPTDGGAAPAYRASASDRESVGRTPGAALDALTAQLDPDRAGSLVIVFDPRPDEFFTAAQRARLKSLLGRKRAAADGGPPLSAAEAGELYGLIDAELDGSARRTAAIARGLGL